MRKLKLIPLVHNGFLCLSKHAEIIDVAFNNEDKPCIAVIDDDKVVAGYKYQIIGQVPDFEVGNEIMYAAKSKYVGKFSLPMHNDITKSCPYFVFLNLKDTF